MSILNKIFVWFGLLVWFTITGLNFFTVPVALLGGVLSSTIIVAAMILNEIWFFPAFYTKQNTGRILALMLVTISILSLIHSCIDFYVLIKYRIVDPHHPFKPTLLFPFIRSFIFILLGTSVHSTITFANKLKEKAEKEKQLHEEKLGTEIKLLKAQINPHFIFNALNNIYSLTYTKAPNAPDSILKLSDMLRYVLDDCTSDHVKLASEITYIENYIAFQQMKSEHEQKIRFTYEGIDGNEPVSPMLIVPFVENSFKYSKIEEYTDAWVNMNVRKTENLMELNIENSVPKDSKALPGTGLGIKNVKQRLDLLYPDKYILEIKENHERYIVNLKMELQ